MTSARGVPSTIAGNHSLSRMVSSRVVSNGPMVVANIQLTLAMTSAHGQASILDWSSTMSAAQRIDSATNANDSVSVRTTTCGYLGR